MSSAEATGSGQCVLHDLCAAELRKALLQPFATRAMLFALP